MLTTIPSRYGKEGRDKMKQTTLLLLFLYGTIISYAQNSVIYKGIKIEQGDLLFVGAQAANLSGAINRVTQRTDSASFDHVGLIDIIEGKPYLMHASGKKGSARELLDSATNKDKRLYVVYRVDDKYKDDIPAAIVSAQQMLGKPYNWSYVLNDSSYYCSDFVERAFRHVGLFELEPMTFKNPKTGDFDEFWVQFYEKQGIAIPEGHLGCNPNGLAASPKIRKIGPLTNGSKKNGAT